MTEDNSIKHPLVLIPFKYPFFKKSQPSEVSFLKYEIQYLKKNFDPLIIAPASIESNKIELPENVILDKSYATSREHKKNRKYFYKNIFTKIFLNNLISNFKFIYKPEILYNLLSFTNSVYHTSKWTEEIISKYNFKNKKVVFYTYWLTYSAVGISIAKKKNKNIIQISRVHSGDVYEGQGRIFFSRKFLLHSINKIFAISSNASNYLKNKFPLESHKITTSRIGSLKNRFNGGSSDDVFRICSCSSMIPLKRIDLLLRGLYLLAKKCPKQFFEWHHFGDGPELERIKMMCNEMSMANFKKKMHGKVLHDDVVKYMGNEPIDLFVNVSSREGIPVSLMEAIAAGIPVVATDVGGCKEIVSNKNGVLLNSNPSPEDISSTIANLLMKPDKLKEYQIGSLEAWEKNFNIDINYNNFIKDINDIINN